LALTTRVIFAELCGAMLAPSQSSRYVDQCYVDQTMR